MMCRIGKCLSVLPISQVEEKRFFCNIQSISNWFIHSLNRYFSATKWDKYNFCSVCSRRHWTSIATRSSFFMCLNKMAVKLSFDERKWLLKCYCKVENVVEVQRRWRVQFGTLPRRVTITRIRDKFEVDGNVQDMLKGRCGRKRSSINNFFDINIENFYIRWSYRW